MLRLLANLERVNEDTIDDLLGEMFGYIVSDQEYEEVSRFNSGWYQLTYA